MGKHTIKSVTTTTKRERREKETNRLTDRQAEKHFQNWTTAMLSVNNLNAVMRYRIRRSRMSEYE